MAVYDINGIVISGGGSFVVNISKSISPNPYDVTIRNVNHTGWTQGGATANTLAAYKASKTNGFFYVETDVRITSDGIPVLHHDDTDGGLAIASNTYADLLAVDAELAKFEDFVALCKHIILHPYIEIKPNITQAQAELLYGMVLDAGLQNDCTWISTNVANLAKIVAIDETQRVGVIRGGVSTDLSSIKTDSNEVFLDAWLEYDVNSTLIAYCKNNGIPLEVYSFYDWNYVKTMDSYITGVTHDTVMAGKEFYEDAMA